MLISDINMPVKRIAAVRLSEAVNSAVASLNIFGMNKLTRMNTLKAMMQINGETKTNLLTKIPQQKTIVNFMTG